MTEAQIKENHGLIKTETATRSLMEAVQKAKAAARQSETYSSVGPLPQQPPPVGGRTDEGMSCDECEEVECRDRWGPTEVCNRW